MPLPMNYTLVRHGLSEANRVQKFMKAQDVNGLAALIDPSFITRHDSTARLTRRGVEQAQITGGWLRQNMSPFDRFYVSPHVRTRETAAHLKLNGEWIVDDRFRERDWGEVSSPTEDFKDPISPSSLRMKELNEWYWKPLGGESLATGVRARAEFVMSSLHRRGESVNNVIAVTHGEFIKVTRFIIERLTPDVYNQQDADPNYKVSNTMVIQYTRQNPHNPAEIRNNFHWRRAICPWDETNSWFNGEWVQFETEKHSDESLLTHAEVYGRLFTDEL